MLALLLLLAQETGAAIDAWRSDDPAARDKASATIVSKWKEADLDALDAASKSSDPEISRRASDATLRIRLRRRVSADLHETIPDFDARLLYSSAEDRTRFIDDVIEAWSCDRIPETDLAILAEAAIAQQLDFRYEALADSLESERCKALAPLLLRAFAASHAPTRAMAAMALGNSGRVDLAPALLPLLKDPDREVRITAITAIESLGPAPFVREIKEALSDTDGTVRGWAVQLLDGLDPKAHLETVRPLLKDPDEHSRFRVLAMMVHAGDPAARDTARAQLDDPSALVRELALRHLDGFKEPSDVIARHLDSPHHDLRETAISILESRNEKSRAPEIAKRLKDPKSRVRIAAVHALCKFEALEFAADVAALLGDTEVREGALRCLGEFRDPGMIASIVPILTDDDRVTRDWAASVLARHDQARVAKAMARLLDDPRPVARVAALQVLAEINALDRASAVLPLLRDPDPTVQAAAAEALDELYSDAVLPDVLTLLKDKKPFIRGSALKAMSVSALKSHGEQVAALLRDSDERVRVLAVRALERTGSPLALISPLLKDDSPDVRLAALLALGAAATTDQLTSLAQDPSTAVRLSALMSKVSLPVAVLRRSAGDADPVIRAMAARLLSAQGAHADVLALASDSDKDVRCAAIDSLVMLRSREQVDLLRAALKDVDDSVRLAALRAAVTLDLRTLAGSVAPLARGGRLRERCTAVEALGRLGGPADALERCLRSRWEDTRMAGVLALARLGHADRALPLLTDPSTEVRGAAIRTLGFDSRHLDAVRPMLDNEDDSIRAAAALALASMGDTSEPTLRKLNLSLTSDVPLDRCTASVTLARLGRAAVDAQLVADTDAISFPGLHETLLRTLNRHDALDKELKLEKPLVTLKDYRDLLAPVGLKIGDGHDFACVDAPRTLTRRAVLERASVAFVIDGDTVRFHTSTSNALRAWEVMLVKK